MATQTDPSTVAAVRRFNRFHTRLSGALQPQCLGSGLTLPQVRVLYELAHASATRPWTAAGLARALAVDAGHMSRLVSGLVRLGLVERRAQPDHAKRLTLVLTPAGRDRFAALDRASADEVAALLAPLSAPDQAQLVGAMNHIRRLLGDPSDAPALVLRDPLPGDLGWVIHRQASLYASEYGWDGRFEGLLAEIMGQFVQGFDPTRERCWIAEREGGIVGSVFVVRADDHTAKLRMLYVEPSARGLGLGRQLVDECLRFARARGYRRMVLWTNDVLVSARRIYEAAGFQRDEVTPHHSFGKDMVGEVWSRTL